jgi:hypothetical protein
VTERMTGPGAGGRSSEQSLASSRRSSKIAVAS